MEKPSTAATTQRSGAVIAGKYRLVSPLAEGGMGSVWRAEDLQLGAPLAVKLLRPQHAHNPEARARFEAEAAMGAQLRSPHVVQIFEFGVDRDSALPFIAMELLEGQSLQERLARSGPMAPRELLWVVSHVAQALTRAHALGIIHRDLKPANIFLVRDGGTALAKVLDFGIAKRFSAAERAQTVTGDLLGTPTYMSPEQITSSRAVDHRSDLWSLGVIAVECLTGRLPFDGENLAGLALAISQGQSLLPSSLGPVPPGFDAWFQRATALRPEARFGSAAQLAEALREVCGGEPASEGLPPTAATATSSAASVLPTPSLPPAPSLTPLRTVQLLRPQQLQRLRHRRKLAWASLGAGALLVLVALSVRLPEAPAPFPGVAAPPAPPASEAFAPPTNTAAGAGRELPGVGVVAGTPAIVGASPVETELSELRAPSRAVPSDAPQGAKALAPERDQAQQRPAAAPPPPAPSSTAAARSAPPATPRRPAAASERQSTAAAQSPSPRPPLVAPRGASAEPAPGPSPVAPPHPSADPDNLGF